FEGQAAMGLEFALAEDPPEGRYKLPLTDAPTGTPAALDWGPLVRGILDDLAGQVAPADIAAKFHHALVEGIVAVARRQGEERVVLTGGCFQNRYLTEHAVRRLQAEGFRPYWHQRIPPNDGGVALGQAAAAARCLRGGERPCVWRSRGNC